VEFVVAGRKRVSSVPTNKNSRRKRA